MQVEGRQKVHVALDLDGSKLKYFISAAAYLGTGCPILWVKLHLQ